MGAIRALRRNSGFLAILVLLLVVGYWGIDPLRDRTPMTGAFQVVDGDSLRRNSEDFRLQGIDAPELKQTCEDATGRAYPCGREAHQMLRRLVQGRIIKCESTGVDRYNRTLAYCRAGDTDINDAMVSAGWAVSYYSLAYFLTELEARNAGLGLWQGAFQSPADWRADHRHSLVQDGVADGAPQPD